MFKKVLRELRRLEGSSLVPVSLELDADGYLDRICPSDECEFEFKVHFEDWRDKVRDEEVFCPFCGHAGTSVEWNTEEQVEHIHKTALAHVQRRVQSAVKRDAREWNRRQSRDGFVRITLRVNSRPVKTLLPPVAATPMKLKITCPGCACSYAVIGAAFFCPACGHNSADLMFGHAVNGILRALDSIDHIREAIPDVDAGEITVRLVVENGLQTGVTAFQRYAEALYAHFQSCPPPRRNAFQNLSEGSDLWYQASGKRYADYLTDEEMASLHRSFQQRHILAHTQGLVDATYVAQTGDPAYRVGQRLVVRAPAVREFIALLRKLTDAMVGDVLPASSNSEPRGPDSDRERAAR